MYEIDRPMCQIAGKVWAIVGASIFLQSARNEHLWKTIAQRELDIWIRLIVAQENVEPRLLLLNQIIFEGQRLALVLYDDVFHIGSFTHQRAGLGILACRLQQV